MTTRGRDVRAAIGLNVAELRKVAMDIERIGGLCQSSYLYVLEIVVGYIGVELRRDKPNKE